MHHPNWISGILSWVARHGIGSTIADTIKVALGEIELQILGTSGEMNWTWLDARDVAKNTCQPHIGIYWETNKIPRLS
jgi:hypothetical protein